jgi:hypothetical protein
VINAESIAKTSPRNVQLSVGQVNLSVDIGFAHFSELNFGQSFYATNKVLYAAAAKIQPTGLGAQSNFDFASVSMGQEAMLRHAGMPSVWGTWEPP